MPIWLEVDFVEEVFVAADFVESLASGTQCENCSQIEVVENDAENLIRKVYDVGTSGNSGS